MPEKESSFLKIIAFFDFLVKLAALGALFGILVMLTRLNAHLDALASGESSITVQQGLRSTWSVLLRDIGAPTTDSHIPQGRGQRWPRHVICVRRFIEDNWRAQQSRVAERSLKERKALAPEIITGAARLWIVSMIKSSDANPTTNSMFSSSVSQDEDEEEEDGDN
ncbi:hypothetical protein MFIFM68171_08270 [Madurella fahalii]|uniref:Uncharacterized protein n=1 Tax=Madurella fahalii TaxID=1157608 RepID=A0ABQ0GKI4_9PEZI